MDSVDKQTLIMGVVRFDRTSGWTGGSGGSMGIGR